MTTRTTSIFAICHGCDWTCNTANALGLAALHHDRHGHPVTVNVARRVQYGDHHAQPAEQTRIPDA